MVKKVYEKANFLIVGLSDDVITTSIPTNGFLGDEQEFSDNPTI